MTSRLGTGKRLTLFYSVKSKLSSLALDAQNRAVEAKNEAMEGLYTSGRGFASLLKKDPDPHFRIKVKSLIRNGSALK